MHYDGEFGLGHGNKIFWFSGPPAPKFEQPVFFLKKLMYDVICHANYALQVGGSSLLLEFASK